MVEVGAIIIIIIITIIIILIRIVVIIIYYYYYYYYYTLDCKPQLGELDPSQEESSVRKRKVIERF